MCQTGIVESRPYEAILTILSYVNNEKKSNQKNEFARLWLELIDSTRQKVSVFTPSYSQMAAVKAFEHSLAKIDGKWQVHYLLSSS